MRTLGLDIGGANTKVVLVNKTLNSFKVEINKSYYFPFWERKSELMDFLQKIRKDMGEQPDGVGVTMTAELSDCFDTKTEGVEYITQVVDKIFPSAEFYSTNGTFLSGNETSQKSQQISAANWHATASVVGKKFPNCILIDMGSTTTDIIPIKEGKPATLGTDDVSRTIYSELLYTGVLRTNLIALTGMKRFPFKDETIRGSPEYFACTADIYRVLGLITEENYTIDTPDGRGKSTLECLSRIAKFICGDLQVVEQESLEQLSIYLMEQQIKIICTAIQEVVNFHELSYDLPITLTSTGAFLAELAARKAGFQDFITLSSQHAGIKATIELSPALAVAILLKDAK